MKYFVSYFKAVHYSGGDTDWVPGNKIIYEHPLDWANTSDIRVMWWKELDNERNWPQCQY